MDYRKTREEIENRSHELLRSKRELAEQRVRIDQELARIETELGGLKQMLAATEVALGRPGALTPPAPGLTEQVRRILKGAQVPLTARQIRDACEAVGIKASSRRNLLVSVYTILKRLQSEVRTGKQNGRLTYFPRPTLRTDSERHRL